MTDTPHLTESIFIATVALANADERAAYIEEACGGDAALRGRVEALLRAHERAGHLLDRPVPGGPERTGACISNAQPGTVIAGRYKLLEAIGEGGMGAVWVAEQTQPVRRKVALKLIKPGMDSKSVLARFDAERQALAVMDHPNIAKVLDGGLTEWGRPFFVMEYVKGVPITEYCDSARLSVPERLNLFVQVCQAVQHAHQKGIIHRDLKPSNILVAPYDDKPVPKVIDFGLAKAMHQSLTERTLHTKHETVLGTPLYMSPEQAQLNNLDVDTRSDIYSLGVLLYELLTGTTPLEKQRFKEAAWEEIKRLVREEEPPRPSTRLSSSNTLASLAAGRQIEPARLTKLVRGELDWIVMKALEKDRTLRYDTANGFAMDIQRYLGGEAVLAAPPSAAYRLRKFARRNKGSLAVAGLVLFFLVLLGSGVGWAMRDRSAREAEAVRQQRERQAKLAGKVESIFGEVDRLKKEQKWPEALEAARRAEAAVAGGEADPATAEQVSQRLKELEFIDRLERIRMEKATLVEGTFNHSGADREYGRAFREYGVDVDELPVETSIDRLKASPALAVVLAAALDDWVYSRRQVSEVDVARWKRLVAVARGIDPEPLRDRVRATWGRPIADVRDDVGRLADSIDVRAQHPATLVILALGLQKAQHPDAALRILREAQHLHPGDFWLNFELGNVLNLRDDREGSTRYWTAAVAIRPSSAGAHNNLGVGLATQKKQDEAIACYRKAIELDPKEANAYSNLGTALVAQKKLPDAIAAYNKAIELDPKLTYAYFGLGNGLSAQKKLPEAIAAYNKAIELDPRLTCAYLGLGNGLSAQKKLPEAIAAYNKAIELDPKDAKAHSSLGIALHDQGKLEEAVTEHCKAIELNPKLARVHSDLGDALRGQGKLDGAVAECRKAIELDPKNAPAHNSLGIALHDQKKPDEAIAEFRKAVELDPEDAKAHTNLGNALRGQKKPDEAVAEHRKAIELDAKDPKAHFNLGNALRAHKKPDEAVAEYLKAIALGLKDANAYGGLGNALHDQKKLPEAIAAFHKAIELDPKDAGAHVNLGTALKDQGKRDEAVAECRMAIALDPKLAMPHYNLANGLRDQGKLEEAVAEYRKAIELDPKYAPAHNSLAAALCEQKKPDEAVAEFCRAIELDPKYAMAHNNLGLALADQGKLPEAIDAYNKAIELDPKYVNAHNNLGIALREQKKLPEAIDAYKRAIELDPKEAGAFRNLGAVLCDELNDFDGAIMCFRKVIELDPKDAAAHRNLGNALSAQKKWDEAFAAYRKAIDLDPKDARAHSTIGIALRQKGRIDEAIAECQTAVELNPKDIFARKSLGNALLAKGRLDEAIAEWKKVIELDSESASAHYALGIALKAKGDSDGAERAYREAVRLDGEHHGAAIDALADLLLSRGNWKEAVATYQKIMILDPKNTWAHYHLGIALKAKGDLDDAIAAFEEVIRRQPDFTSAHFALASALAEAKQWDRSASVYAAALKRFGAPLWPGPWYEAIRSDEVFTRLTAQQPDGRLPWIMRARLHALDRDWKRAATDYAHLYGSLANIDPAKHFPEGGDDLFGYGCLLLLQGDRPGYEQFCKQWAERVGDSAAWGFNLARAWGISSRPVVSAHLIVERAGKALQASRTAWNLHALSLAHYRNGEFERAIKRAEESNGGNWSGSAKALNWLVLAMAHSRLGQAADAHKSLQQALDLAGRASPEQPPGVEWPDMAPPDFVEFELLRREAEELINPKAKEERDK